MLDGFQNNRRPMSNITHFETSGPSSSLELLDSPSGCGLVGSAGRKIPERCGQVSKDRWWRQFPGRKTLPHVIMNMLTRFGKTSDMSAIDNWITDTVLHGGYL